MPIYSPMKNKLTRIINILLRALSVALIHILTFSLSVAAPYQEAKDIKEVVVDVSFENASLKEVFDYLESKTDFSFGYDANIVNSDVRITLTAKQKSVDFILREVSKKASFQFRQVGNDIDIKETKSPSPKKSQSKFLISGVVTSGDDGLSLPGVGIAIKGTTTGTTTDADGNYDLAVEKGDVLIFSFVGYSSTEMVVEEKTKVDVILQPDIKALQEIIVVGFGTQRKISFTGSQSTVEASELKQPVSNISTLLAGRISGVVGVQRSGEPGRDRADIWIRGISTFNSSNPLVLVDGVDRSIDNIDPQDIESFTILKDASATAVYGVRGANGVILVKTKRGKIGPPQVYLDYNEGISTFTRKPEIADAGTYMSLLNESLTTRGQNPLYTQDYIDKTLSNADPMLYPSVNWMDEVFKKFGRNRRVNLNASGGIENAQYYISLNYYNETGFLKTDQLQDYNTNPSFTRYNFTSNLNLKLTPSTKLDLGIQGYTSNGNYPGESTQTIFSSALEVSPVEYPVMYPGNFIPGKAANGGIRNPYADLTRRGYRNEFTNQIYSNLRGTQNLDVLLKGLSFTTMFAFDAVNTHGIDRRKREDTWAPDTNTPYKEDGSLNLVRTFTGTGNYLSYGRSNDGRRMFYVESAFNYEKDINRHSIGGLVLFNSNDASHAFAGDFSGSIPRRYMGLAGRATYSYDDRYFLEFNAGYNGSENFAPSKRFGFFPALGVGWVISNEKFYQSIENTISFLKLRYSDGMVGSSEIPGRRFGFLTLVAENSGLGYTFGKDFSRTPGINVTDYAVDVTWEESRKQDFGVEIRAIDDKLNIIFDVFQEHRKGIFLNRGSVPGFVGLVKSPSGNLGIVENKGFDASLQYTMNIFNEIELNVRGNVTYNKDKVADNDQPDPAYPWMDRRANNLLARYGYIAEGLFESYADVAASAVPGDKSIVRPGDIKYKDLNEDGLINAYDVAKIGRGDVPSLVYGFGLQASYKGFSLGAFFQGLDNADIELAGRGIIPFAYGGNVYSNASDRWTPEYPSQNVLYPRLAYGEAANFNNLQRSSWWIKDVSFLRLKSAQLSYNVPARLYANKGIKNIQVYLIGYNVLTFSKFKLWDPELLTSNGARYPNVSTTSLGFNLKF
jgi:TonB-linked SusC/RagA family outer membrane protein